MEKLLSIPVWDGKTVGDLISPEFIATLIGSILAAIAILIAGFIFAGWLRRRIIKMGFKYEQLDDTLFVFLGNISRYVVIGFAVVFVLNTFNVQTTSLVALIGAAGLAIGLALQGTLSNIAAGVMIILFRPIRLDDFVEVNGQAGTVKAITLNFTELATLDNVQVIIPNAQVWGNTIVNYSVYTTRRAEWVFGVGYGANLKQVEQVIRDTILADPRAHAEPEPFIQVNTLNDSSVDFLVRVWCDRGDLFAFKTDMMRQVKEAFDTAGVEIPFPTRTIVHVNS